MKISVITWDASFRESFHTVRTFKAQEFPTEQYEFIWVDFYKADEPKLMKEFEDFSNARVLSLDHEKSEQWHIAECLNRAIEQARGDIIVIPDGDIIVYPNFVNTIHDALSADPDQVLYFPRWDEPPDESCEKSREIEHLEEHCKLFNPINYGGCIAAHRKSFAKVGYYDEHRVFAGPGCIHMEMALRLKNAGFHIHWHTMKIFHPYHEATGSSDKKTREMEVIALQNQWLNPYNGIEQSWVLHKRRECTNEFSANNAEISRYLEEMPTLDSLRAGLTLKTRMRFLIHKILKRIRS